MDLSASSRPRNPNRLNVEWLEDRVVPSRPLPFPVIFAGSGAGSPAVVRAFDAETGELNFERPAFEPTFTGGVHVAAADLTGDGYPDAVLAPGTGGGPRVRVLDGKTGEPVRGPIGNFLAYDPAFVGGVAVAAADVTGDDRPEIITAAGAGGGPHVKVFDGRTGRVLHSFFALDPDFRGGVAVAAADYTGDRKAEVVVGAGVGGGPRVRILDLTTGRAIPGPLGDFFAADSDRRSGVSVGTDALAGDVNADGTPDLVTGSGAGEASRVVVYSGKDGSVLSEFSPFGPEMTAGVRVATAYVTDDAHADVVVGTGPGVESRVRVYDGATGQLVPGPVADFTPFGPGATGGVFVAASNDPLTPPYSAAPVTWDVVCIDPQFDPNTYHVTVGVDVVIDPVDPGRYLWTYKLKNLDFTDGVNVFILGFSGTDIADVTATHGFTQIGGLHWESGYLPIGQTATFTFTTDPWPIVDIWGEAFDQLGMYYGPSSNKVKGPGVVEVKADIDIDGTVDGNPFTETTEDSIGGLVVERAEGNNAPRKKIVIQQIPGWTGDVLFTKVSGDVKVFDAATGGTEVTFNGTANKFANANLPKTLYVQGNGASGSMRDTDLKAEPIIVNANEQGVADTVSFTVLWVDVSVSFTGSVSSDNDKADVYKNVTTAKHYALGLQTFDDGINKSWGWGYEARGLVYPAEFSYPGSDLKLDRDVQNRWYKGSDPLGPAIDFTAIPPGNDTGPAAWRDDNPLDSDPPGQIFDLDYPRIFTVTSPQDEIRRMRFNFKEFADITIDGTLVRASDIYQGFVRFSIKQTTAPTGSTWVITNDVVGDNDYGTGTTKITWNLT